MSRRSYYLLLAAIAPILALVRGPRLLWLGEFAHADQGAVLSLAKLTSEGYSPGVDFTLQYGLLPVALGDAVFGLFGIEPIVYAAMTVVAAGAYCLALGWAVEPVGPRVGERVLVVLGLAFGAAPPISNVAHYLEPTLISLALGWHVRNRRGTALVVLTIAAALVKPALAYVYGLWLTIEIVRGELAAGPGAAARIGRQFLPASVAGLGLGLLLALRYGWRAVVATMLPGAGVTAYRMEDFGFFRAGSVFWSPVGKNWKYYVGLPAGFWLVATAVLSAAAIVCVVRLLRGRGSPVDRLIAVCGTLHLTFILLMFGPPGSWGYDFNILLIGVTAATATFDRRGPLAWALAAATTGMLYTVTTEGAECWRHWQRVPQAPRLYATPEGVEQWSRLTKLAETEQVFVFNILGGASSVDARLKSPRSWCLYWYHAPDAEIQRTRADLAAADVVVIPRYFQMDASPNHPAYSPVFAEQMREFHEVEAWPLYRILRRTRPTKPPRDAL